MVKNAYIHIPFCRSKCKYCSFISYTDFELQKKYVNALENEILAKYKGEKLNTLYFGGGTPSLLDWQIYERFMKMFRFEEGAEITIECNPEGITFDYLMNLKRIGINRISFGAQTFNDNILKIIGRRHSSYDIDMAVNCAKACGFDNISLDFIYGLPTQQVGDLMSDLTHAIDLGVQHISMYGLKIENGWEPSDLPDDDIQADMYMNAVLFLTRRGFKQYEISNFSKNGFESSHNTNYWNNNSYYGFGCAAHGYEGDTRYGNETALEKYIEKPTEHAIQKELTNKEKLEEEIFLGFRRWNGVDVKSINEKFGIDFEAMYRDVLYKYINTGHIERIAEHEDNKKYALTLQGILLSNYILADFLID